VIHVGQYGEWVKCLKYCDVVNLESCALVVTDTFDKRARACVFTDGYSVCRRINFVISMQLGAMKMKLNMAAVTVRCASHAEDTQGHA
jgi:hypothetical protein